MVSALWKACSEGDLESVRELLKEASTVDIEIKDHTGVTPLIEAVKNGHIEVVRALLEKGADSTNGSSQGRPEQYTSEPSILELLNSTQNQTTASGIPSHESVYTQDANDDSDKRYYGHSPPVTYTYYPTINSAPPHPEGGGFYPPQPPPPPPGEAHSSGGVGNLPPPEIARFIPCRYFPACRYGASCLFAHPQAPYFQGPLPPPAQYVPSYDQMSAQPYAPNYYAVPPPPFQQPNGIHHMTPPGPHPVHARSPSEVIPPAQNHYGPNGVPPPSPYGHMSPSAYSHPGQIPVPMSIPPLPPLQHQPSLPAPSPQSPNMYNTVAPTVLTFATQDIVNQYPTPNTATAYQDDAKPQITPDVYNSGPTQVTHRDSMNHNRRGNPRRGSFGGRKPPCLFFPAGRCKNGDECRFPHVISEGPGSHHVPYFSGRGGPRSRHVNGNGFATINEKMADTTIQDDTSRQPNGAGGSSRSHSSDPGRPRYPHGAKGNPSTNGVRADKRPSTVKQRVPNADEFPVLAGSTTPPSRSPGLNGVLPNGSANGAPTAAQVLQAPPPIRKDSAKESSTRGATPDPVKPTATKAETNGIVFDATPSHDHTVNKLPISFAAVATAAPDIPKEITLSA